MPRPHHIQQLWDTYKQDRVTALRRLRKYSNFVPGEGSLTPRAFIIGEAPGATEDKLERPFCGASGNLLDSMLYVAGLKRADIWITNVVKYRPPKNRAPWPDEIAASLPVLRREFNMLMRDGGLIVTLGATALSIFDTVPHNSISLDHGLHLPVEKGKWTLVPMFHPSYVLQHRTSHADYEADWRRLGKVVNGRGLGKPASS